MPATELWLKRMNGVRLGSWLHFKKLITSDNMGLRTICEFLNNDIQKIVLNTMFHRMTVLFLRLNTSYGQLLKWLLHIFLFACLYVFTVLMCFKVFGCTVCISCCLLM